MNDIDGLPPSQPSPANTQFPYEFLGARDRAHDRKARGIAILVLALVAALVMTPAQAQRPDPMSFGNPATSASIQQQRFGRSLATPDDQKWRPARRSAPGSRAPVPGVVSVGLDAATHTLYAPSETSNTVAVIDARSCNARRLHCHAPVATVPTAHSPSGIAVDQVTHTIYVASFEDANVQVIDGRHCNARTTSGCGAATSFIPIGGHPLGIAINRSTHTVYVGNVEDKVTVIDGNACNGSHRTGCAAPLATIVTGPGPGWPFADAATGTLYVPDGGNDAGPGDTLSIIDTRACNAQTTSGCGRTPVTVRVGNSPNVAVVDPATDTLYVGNHDDKTLSVINRSTCNASNTSGCVSGTPVTVSTGQNPEILALSPKTRTLYVQNDADTVAAVDLRHCHAQDSSACAVRPHTLQTGARPFWIDLDPRTASLYVADRVDGVVEVLDARSCNARRAYGCRHEAPTVAGGDGGGSMDPGHHTLYQPLQSRHSIGFIDTATCNSYRRDGCRKDLLTVQVGEAPGNMAIDNNTHTLYIVDSPLELMHVINTDTCNVSRQDGCAPVASIPVPHPGIPNLNSRTHTVYVAQYATNSVAVISGAHCNGHDQTQCGAPLLSVPAGSGPNIPWVDVATNTVYVTNTPGPDGNRLAVLPGAACDARTSGCHAIATTEVGRIPIGLASDASTHTLYVGNWSFGDEPGSVSIVDTHKCGAQNISGCGTTWPRVAAGHGSFGVTYEPRRHNVYTTNADNATISVINARRCNAVDTSGCHATSPRIAVGYFPTVTYVDPIRHTLYVENAQDLTASLINTRHPCRPNLCFR